MFVTENFMVNKPAFGVRDEEIDESKIATREGITRATKLHLSWKNYWLKRNLISCLYA